MLCILCVNFNDQIIDIFSEEGFTLNVCNVITKHFWMQPNKNDQNARYICGSCWNALYLFHNFYKQVEEAHLSLLTATAIPEEDLKPEDVQIAAELDGIFDRSIDKYDSKEDYSKKDVKLEFKEDGDGETCLPLFKHEPEFELKLDAHEIEKQQDQHSLIDSSDDSDYLLDNFSETHTKKRRTSVAKTTTSCNDSNHLNHNSDYEKEGSDFEVKYKPTPLQKVQSGKKRGRPLKVTRKKITSKEQFNKQELSNKFDYIIKKHMKLTCNICQLALKDFFSLKKHYRKMHNEEGYASCCNKKFLKRGVLVDHINTHLNPEHFKCGKCNKVLAARRCLEIHMNIHSEEKQRTYQCDQCDKSFLKKRLLMRHMRIHMEERKFQCEECNKIFSRNFTLKRHIKSVH